MDAIRNATAAVVASWAALVAVIGVGVWREHEMREYRCEVHRQERAALEAIDVGTFTDLGVELGADDEQIAVFVARIERRYDGLPDPC